VVGDKGKWRESGRKEGDAGSEEEVRERGKS